MAVQEKENKKEPLLNNWILLFLLAMILANIGGNMYGSLLPLYLQDLDATIAQVGLFFTLSQVIPLTMQILGGWVSDSLGRLRAIAIGSVAGVFANVGLVLAPTWEWVLVAVSIGAITRSLVGPSFDAFIAEQSSEQNRARVFGITQALFGIVAVVGPPLGGWLAGAFGFKLMLLVAAGLYILATIIRVSMARVASRGAEANPTRLTLSSLKTNLSSMFGLILSGGVITWILLTDGIRDSSFALSMNLMPIFMEDIGGLSLQQIGIINGIFGLFMMAFTIPGGWLADKTSERVGIATGFVLISGSFFLFLQAGSAFVFGLSWAIAGTGVGLLTPAYQSLISKAVPEKLRGTAFGLFSTSLGLVSLPAPMIGAMLWERFTPALPFVITAWVALFSIVPVWLKFRLPKVKTEAVAAD